MSEHPETEGTTALPVYLVLDTSASLMGEIDSINTALADILNSLIVSPRVNATVWISLIQFSDGARTVIPLSQASEISEIPALVVGGSTNYSAAFNLVYKEISADVHRLKDRGYRVLRPVMFFMTDGSPVDPGWLSSLDSLRSTHFVYRPTIVAVGFGSVDPAIIREIGSGKGGAFMISDAISIREAIGSIGSALPMMIGGTIASSRAPGQAHPVNVPAQWLDLRLGPNEAAGQATIIR